MSNDLNGDNAKSDAPPTRYRVRLALTESAVYILVHELVRDAYTMLQMRKSMYAYHVS